MKNKFKFTVKTEVWFSGVPGQKDIAVTVWIEGGEVKSKAFSFDELLKAIDNNRYWVDPDKIEARAYIAKRMRKFLEKLER